MLVRTITFFADVSQYRSGQKATSLPSAILSARQKVEGAGYVVQTVRVVHTGAEGDLQALGASIRLHLPAGTLLSMGAMRDPAVVPSLGPALASQGLTSCAVVPVHEGSGVPDRAMCRAAAEAITAIGASSAPEGNFCFAAVCPGKKATSLDYAPFFPSAHVHSPAQGAGLAFSLGFQFPSVLHAALASVLGPVSGHGQGLPAHDLLVKAEAAAHKALAYHYAALCAVAKDIQASTGAVFKGIDGSLAPLPSDSSSVTDIYSLLGVRFFFGSPGTLQASAWLTRVLKSVPLPAGAPPLLGYTGLMLPPMEDRGLATDAVEGQYGLSHLLMCSAVCGVGLDTVPIPGDTPAQEIEAIIADVASLAWRLDKPLSVRLFPLPGLKAGDMTQVTNNPHLCNTKVFAV